MFGMWRCILGYNCNAGQTFTTLKNNNIEFQCGRNKHDIHWLEKNAFYF